MNRGDVKLIIDRCVAHDVPDAADLIEHQAAQLEMLRLAAERVSWKFGHDNDGNPSDWSEWSDLRDALSPQPDDSALEQFAAKVREQCAKVCENEYPYTVFHTDQRAAINCAAAIRAIKELPPAN